MFISQIIHESMQFVWVSRQSKNEEGWICVSEKETDRHQFSILA